LGQKRTLHRSNWMSALPPKADMPNRIGDVRFVPQADKVRRSKQRAYSITSSASNCI
jgi:hypothetical protein